MVKETSEVHFQVLRVELDLFLQQGLELRRFFRLCEDRKTVPYLQTDVSVLFVHPCYVHGAHLLEDEK